MNDTCDIDVMMHSQFSSWLLLQLLRVRLSLKVCHKGRGKVILPVRRKFGEIMKSSKTEKCGNRESAPEYRPRREFFKLNSNYESVFTTSPVSGMSAVVRRDLDQSQDDDDDDDTRERRGYIISNTSLPVKC
ncbi:hypothetical protein F2P81_019882 [Scophthalmus maximus]|uniref:Uncharacterized protein n=1 Tax=Scophthalmus maximus TaxID=52904 RepID=A0A6A4S7Q9_SCOMX|nr:hypothetical protein F2P81_019882 [Scophthalmus maximus]